jgi:hypothetical protein
MNSINYFNRLGKTFCRLWSALMLAATILMAGPRVARADHRGSPGVLSDPATNINDVYAFVDPNNTAMVVLAMTVNGYTVGGINAVFAPDCLYQFKIDNTGDFVEDLVIQVVFDKPTGEVFAPVQNYTVIGPVKPPKRGGINKVAKTNAPFIGPVVNVPATGASAGIPVSTFNTFTNNLSVFCGLRDDAFNFDEIFIRNILRGTLAAPNPPNTGPNFRGAPGVDFYARMNCSTIVIELPSSLLTGTLVNDLAHKQLNIWATTSLPSVVTRVLKTKRHVLPKTKEIFAKTFVQHDRVALPRVSTFLIDDENKDAFAQGQPKDDAEFYKDEATLKIQKMQLDPTSPTAIAALANLLAIRFPDVLALDVTSTAGFPTVDFSGAVPKGGNGRRPQDDVISFELGLLTVGAVTNEGVGASNGLIGGNDVPLLVNFPFFAPPHVPKETTPARN